MLYIKVIAAPKMAHKAHHIKNFLRPYFEAKVPEKKALIAAMPYGKEFIKFIYKLT